MNAARLFLNCFPVELSSTAFEVPFLDYDAWEVSTEALREDYAGYLAYRYETDNGRIRIILLDGPQFPEGLGVMNADLAELPYLGERVIERSMAHHLTTKGLVTRWTGFETMAMKRTPEFSRGIINIHSGISFQVRRPFAAEPYGFVISVKWEVSPSFERSLADASLRAISVGMPVLYRPAGSAGELPQELRKFRHRYLGRVREIRSDTEAVVYCRDDQLRQVPLADLVLEASPEAIRAYERESATRHEIPSIWHKIQELNFVLNAAGRRNPSVLKDRLQAIRRVLGGGAREQLVLPLSYFRGGSLSIGLSPVRVEVS